MTERTYPDEPAGQFPTPPRTFTDESGREVEVRVADRDDQDAVVEMYREFDPDDRAQGIPPVREDDVREWTDQLLGEECVNVLAIVDGAPVGHATLVPDVPKPRMGGGEAPVGEPSAADATAAPQADGDGDGDEEYELAIFVLREYQGAGIGTELLKTLLGRAREVGIECVWLTVERWNEPALSLYKSVGFVTSDAEAFELEMAIRL